MARSAADLEIVRDLFLEYARWLAIDLSFQGFEEELQSLPGKYAPPEGGILLLESQESTLGCAAFRPQAPEVCEVKRLWIRPEARRKGYARQLMSELESAAATVGYRRAVLDTLETMTPAIELYESLGYERTSAYYNNPLPGAVYLSKKLNK
jgi:ribosomal protein S18 acetylase RimI-like enzyme